MGAAGASVTVKVVAADLTPTKLLHLPAELTARGWAFSLLAIGAGVLLALIWPTRSGEIHRGTGQLINATLCLVGAAVCVLLFLATEFAWKRAPSEAFDFLYFWVEPFIFGAIFGCFSAALTLALMIEVSPTKR